MKYILRINLIILLLSSMSFSEVLECNNKCKKDSKTGYLLCKLSNMPQMPIIAKDVFKVDGTLKTFTRYSAPAE